MAGRRGKTRAAPRRNSRGQFVGGSIMPGGFLHTPVSLDQNREQPPVISESSSESDSEEESVESMLGGPYYATVQSRPTTPTRDLPRTSTTHSPSLNRNPKPGFSPMRTPSPQPTSTSSTFVPYPTPAPVTPGQSAPVTLQSQPLLVPVSQVESQQGVAPVTQIADPAIAPVTQFSPPPRVAALDLHEVRVDVAEPRGQGYLSPSQVQLPLSPTPPPETALPAVPTPLTPPPATGPVMTTPVFDRASLNALPEFDGSDALMPEARWRYNFLRATRGLSDAQKAEEWIAKAQWGSIAYWFIKELRSDAATAGDLSAWSTLEPHVEGRWPTPAEDPEPYRQAMRKEFDGAQLSLSYLTTALEQETGPVAPHAAWVRQFQAAARYSQSSDSDKVKHTLARIPEPLIDLLPDKRAYTSFATLCSHIAAVSSESLLPACKKSHRLDELEARLAQLSVQMESERTARTVSMNRGGLVQQRVRFGDTPSLPRQASGPLPVSNPPGGAGTLLHGQPTQGGPPAPVTPVRATSVPPQTPIPAPPSLQPTQVPQTPRGPAPPPRDLPPHLIPPADTPENRLAYQARVQQWMVENPSRRVSSSSPFPLSPGTLPQSKSLCVKCARADHNADDCEAPRDLQVPEKERTYRTQLRGRLWNVSGQARRAGAQPGTPTPAYRPMEAPVQLVEVEEARQEAGGELGSDEFYEFVASEN